MADREKTKRQFKMVESDTEELDKKIRKHRLKIVRIVIAVVALVLLSAGAAMLIFRMKEYTAYDVIESGERTDTIGAKYLSVWDGVIKYSNDGASYTNYADELIWNQTYEMQEPMVDVCEDYVAFAEKGGKKIYILNKEKLQGSVETTMDIVSARVANQGTVAVLMQKDGISYIRLYDKSGKNLAGGQIGIENTGYPLDIALSNDAIKLAVTMLDINEGNIKSMVVFYNFGSVGQNEIDHMVGSSSFSGMIIPQIEFVSNDRLLAFGDSEIMIFEGKQKPTMSKEIRLEKDIKSLFYNENYFGWIQNNDDENNTRHMELYDTKGIHILSKDFAMDYDKVELLPNNEICIQNQKECLIYNTYGVKHFSCSFDEPLYHVIAGSTGRNYTFIFEDTVEKVRLK